MISEGIHGKLIYDSPEKTPNWWIQQGQRPKGQRPTFGPKMGRFRDSIIKTGGLWLEFPHQLLVSDLFSVESYMSLKQEAPRCYGDVEVVANLVGVLWR